MAKQTQDDVRPIPKPFHYDGPDYQGFVFTLASGSGKPNHTLTITTQKREVFLAPAITGTWEGAGDGAPKSVTGAITGISGDGIDAAGLRQMARTYCWARSPTATLGNSVSWRIQPT